MPNDLSNATFSEVDGSNNSAAPNGWQSGVMTPVQLEPTARALAGALKRFYNHVNASAVSGGTANAQTLTYAVAPTAYVTGDSYAFIVGPGLTNTGATTLDVNGLGAIAVQTAGVALVGGEWAAGGVAIVHYDGVAFQTAGYLFGARSSTRGPLACRPTA